MRFRGPSILLGVVLLLTFIWLAHPERSDPPNDLSAGFLGFTNNPGASVYPRLSVVGDGRGLYALFAVTNVSQRQYIRFGISAVETGGEQGWAVDESWGLEHELGSVWSPGYRAVYAIPWPAKASIDRPWRLRLWVMREPKLVFIRFNQRLGREIFRPYGRHTVPSDVVPPMKLLLIEPSGYIGNAQPAPAA